MFEPIAWKREAALKAGADYVLDPLAPDFHEKAMKITDGYGFDVIFECSGAKSTIASCYDLMSRGGVLELMALFKPEITLDAIWTIQRYAEGSHDHCRGVPVSLHYAEGGLSAGSTGNGVP